MIATAVHVEVGHLGKTSGFFWNEGTTQSSKLFPYRFNADNACTDGLFQVNDCAELNNHITF